MLKTELLNPQHHLQIAVGRRRGSARRAWHDYALLTSVASKNWAVPSGNWTCTGREGAALVVNTCPVLVPLPLGTRTNDPTSGAGPAASAALLELGCVPRSEGNRWSPVEGASVLSWSACSVIR